MVLKEGVSVKVAIFRGYGTRDWDFNSKLKLYLLSEPGVSKQFLHKQHVFKLNIFVFPKYNQTQNKIWVQKQSKQADF